VVKQRHIDDDDDLFDEDGILKDSRALRVSMMMMNSMSPRCSTRSRRIPRCAARALASLLSRSSPKPLRTGERVSTNAQGQSWYRRASAEAPSANPTA
jgi:hypothetical protein